MSAVAAPVALAPLEGQVPHDAFRLSMCLHNPPVHPHWSEAVEWPAERWDPLTNAPTMGRVLEVRGRTAEGRVIEPVHYACGDGDGLMPSFDGWFRPVVGSAGKVLRYDQVQIVEWQPLSVRAPDAAVLEEACASS